jgi:hypothetical protein
MMMTMMMASREEPTSWGWTEGRVWRQSGEAIAVHVT